MRFFPGLATLAIVALTLTACAEKQQKPVTHTEEPYRPLDTYDRGTTHTQTDPIYAEDAAAVDPAAPALTEPAPDTTDDQILIPADGGQVHLVQRGDTLYKLARQYYNDQNKWKEIWEANRARLADPNKLRVGMKLIIP